MANPSGTTVARPASMKLLEGRGNGRDSGGRVVKQPPAFTRELPDKPDGLTADAGQLWDLVVEQLDRLSLIKELDGSALRIGCETFGRWCEAVRLRHEHGITSESSQGVGVAPWVRVEESASREFRAWCAEFGLTPAAEMRLATEASDGAGAAGNPFAEAG